MEQETIENRTNYECDICESVFKRVNKLKVHYIHFHREKKFKCDKCGKSFPFKSLLKYHMPTCKGKYIKKNKMKNVEYKKIFDIDGNAKFQCCKCEKIFRTLRHILQHIYILHREKKHQCDKCEKKFTFLHNLRCHLENHHGVSRLTTKTSRSMTYQVIESHEEKKYQCNKCQEMFSELFAFYYHFRVHKEKKFKCDKCGKSFIFKSQLHHHMKKYDEKKDGNKELKKNRIKNVEYKKIFDSDGKAKFQCCKCEKIFRTLNYILQHIYVVHREKKHKCDKCERKFAFISSLKKHLLKCDSIIETKTQKGSGNKVKKNLDYKKIVDIDGNKKFQCCKCEKDFRTIQNVLQHIHRKHREKESKCDKCKKTFVYKFQLNNHLKKCDGICRTRNKVNKDLDYKKITDDDGIKKFQCCTCEKIFGTISSITQHIRIVHRKKEHKCGKCNKLFTFPINLKYHQEKCDGIFRTRSFIYQIIKSNEGERYQCNICKEVFSEKAKCCSHYQQHKEKKFKCENCSKMFLIKSKMTFHFKSCDGIPRKRKSTGSSVTKNSEFKISSSSYKVIESEVEKRYECCLCEAKFKERGKFARHFYQIHKEKTLKCDNCDKYFAHSSLRSIHLKNCIGKSLPLCKTKENITYKKIQAEDNLEKVQCIICDKVFESVNLFHGHYFYTHREKRFKCYKCSKSFSRESIFNNHSCQNQEKTFKCDKCSKSFDFAYNVRRHNKIVHEKESNIQLYKKHKCDICGKSFCDKLKLDKHLITHDYEIVISDDKMKRFQCKICQENFKSKPELYQHFYRLHLRKSIKIHKCDICDKICTDTWKLRIHLKGHELKMKLQYEIFRDSHSKKYYRCKKCQITSTSLCTFKTHFKESHLPERNDGPKTISSNDEDKSNLCQEVSEDTTKKGHKISQVNFDISTIKLSGTDVLTIANIREENDVIETDSNLKLESDGEFEKLYRVENNDIDPIGALNKEDLQIKTETEETILGF